MSAEEELVRSIDRLLPALPGIADLTEDSGSYLYADVICTRCKDVRPPAKLLRVRWSRFSEHLPESEMVFLVEHRSEKSARRPGFPEPTTRRGRTEHGSTSRDFDREIPVPPDGKKLMVTCRVCQSRRPIEMARVRRVAHDLAAKLPAGKRTVVVHI